MEQERLRQQRIAQCQRQEQQRMEHQRIQQERMGQQRIAGTELKVQEKVDVSNVYTIKQWHMMALNTTLRYKKERKKSQRRSTVTETSANVQRRGPYSVSITHHQIYFLC